jgi:hypothetical protein
MSNRSLALTLAGCALAIASVNCGFGNGNSSGQTGAAGSSSTGSSGANGGGAGNNGGGAGNNGGGAGNNGGGAGNNGGGGGGSTGTSGSSGGDVGSGTGGATPTAGTTGTAGTTTSGWKNYEVTGTFLKAPVAIAQKSGQLKYTKVVIQDQFLAESCSIGDYNGDGIPDVSSGRIWYEGTNDATTTFKTQHPFRDGHGALPRLGASEEINTGVSDDWADYPWDVDGDGDTDIINIAQCDVPESNSPTQNGSWGTPNKIGTVQVHATAVWYENPGKAGNVETITTNWKMHLMHADVRNEQRGLVDINGDGYPEFFGACRSCNNQTKGYYQGDPKNPTAMWTYHTVMGFFAFPFGGTGWMHGMGAGDINGDGLADLMDRRGAYIQQKDGTFNLNVCTGNNTPAGCGFIQQGTPLLPGGGSNGPQGGFYDGLPDSQGNKGASHMYGVDMDKDGCTDVVAADWAHGVGLAWYQQKKDATSGACTYAFTKYPFMGDSQADKAGDVTKWGAGFTEPHSLQVFDMDGDGRFDVITGKMRFAHPINQNDPDPHGTPYLYVFKNMDAKDPNNGGPITLKPILVDGNPSAMEGSTDAGMGVGRQIAIGHVNTDGILDICVGSKLGLAVFLGQ